jgi:cell division septum initiation protein DivIVA
MPGGSVTFSEQPMGYDKQQVDSYVAKITLEYQTVYNEYMSMVNKYNSLTETCIRLTDEKNRAIEQLNQSMASKNTITPNSSMIHMSDDAAAIAKALIDAEKLAKQIVDDAHVEASRVRDEINRLHTQKDRLIVEFNDMKSKIVALFPER